MSTEKPTGDGSEYDPEQLINREDLAEESIRTARAHKKSMELEQRIKIIRRKQKICEYYTSLIWFILKCVAVFIVLGIAITPIVKWMDESVRVEYTHKERFGPARVVEDKVIIDSVIEWINLTKQMKLYMLSDNTYTCGLSLTHMGRLEQMVVMSPKIKGLTPCSGVFFNPKITEYRGDSIQTQEEDPLCGDTKYHTRTRKYGVVLDMQCIDGTRIATVQYGDMAVCMQHFVDLLDGVWPCDSPMNKSSIAYITL